jgi:hypothetical protein
LVKYLNIYLNKIVYAIIEIEGILEGGVAFL